MELFFPTIAEIDLNAIRRNSERILRHVAPAGVMAVVKADAYGHGAIRVAETVLKTGVRRLAVANLQEGLQLRQAGIGVPVQVFGGFLPEQIATTAGAHLEFTIGSLPQMEALAGYCRRTGFKAKIHLKFDTGMGRVGFAWQGAAEIFSRLSQQDFELTGLMTHFATSDEEDKTFARRQLKRFEQVAAVAKKCALEFQYIHAANSGAILDLPEARFNLVRPGVILYGNYPSQETSESIPLKPAMSLRSKIMQIKKIRAGESVSYGAVWRAVKDTLVAVVPVGYADGYLRGLSGKIAALINGRRAPQIGRICMDLTMFDLGPDGRDKAGDEVILLGSDDEKSIGMQAFCQALDTIPYEITCQISKRIPRVYV